MTSTRSVRSFRLFGLLVAGALVLAGLAAPAFAATKYPPKPTSLRASVTSTAIYLNWTSGKGSTKGFNVYRSTSSTVSLKYPLNGKKLLTRTSFSSTKLTSNKSYWFVVQSVNAAGKKSSSSKFKATTLPQVPNVPTLSAVAGNNKVSLTWKAATKGGTVTSWNVYRSTTATTAATIVKPANLLTTTKLAASARAYVNTTALNGTTYHYVVVGSNGGGSASSNVVTAVPFVPAPGTPVLAATSGDHTVALSWTAAGEPATSWDIYRSSTSSVGVQVPGNFLKNVGAAPLATNDATVTNGTTYYYVVVAKNAGGTKSSNVAAAMPVLAAPATPTLTATPGDGKVVLNWAAGSGGGAVASWKVYRSTTTPVSTAGAALTSPAAATLTYTDSTALNGTKYYYVVTAINATATKPSAEANATPVLAAPSAPTLTATAGDAKVDLSWTAGAGGGAVAGWSIYRSTTLGGAATGTLVTTRPTGTTTYTDTGRTNGTTYYYVVKADNATSSVASAEKSAMPTLPVPAAAVLNSSPGDGIVTLSWTPGLGGGAVAGWSIYRSTSAGVSTSGAPFDTASAGATSYPDNSVVNGTTYHYKIVATNATGAGAASNETSAKPTAASTAALTISNAEAVLGTPRFIMSRMGYVDTPNSSIRLPNPDNSNALTWYRLHDVAQVHVKNTGTSTAHITDVTVSNAVTYDVAATTPFDLAPGAETDIPVRFTYAGGPNNCDDADRNVAIVCTGTLTIAGDGMPNTVVPLAGLWQPGPNRSPDTGANWEPFFGKVVNNLYGFQIPLGATSNSPLDSGNASFTFSSDEVSSSFWHAANPASPVTVRRLSAHTAVLASINWYPSSAATGCSTSAEANCHNVVPLYSGTGAGAAYDPATANLAQGALPVPVGGAQSYSFSPGATAFGLQLDVGFGAQYLEFSDHNRNDKTNDTTLHGCTPVADCGQHVRFFKLRDSNGALVPNAYVVTFDLSGLNNDFNDNVLLVTNLAAG